MAATLALVLAVTAVTQVPEVAEVPLVVLLVALGKVTLVDVIAAWVFVLGRVIHTLVQTLTDNVPLRGQVFMINFLAVLALAAHVVLLAWEGIGR